MSSYLFFPSLPSRLLLLNMGTKRSASSSAGRNVRTRTSTSSTRIDVVLFKHCKIALPVDDSTTIADLKAEALRRALALNLQIPSGDVVCRLDVTDGPMAFDDDLVLALLPKDGKPLCWLGSVSDVSLQVPSKPSVRVNEVQVSEDEVYIRWITPSRALDHTTLNHIGTDRGVSGSTTIKELRAFALEDLYNLPDSTESPIKPDVKLELFLTSCGLRSIDDKETTLDQLGCVSSQSEPLDIFVVPFNNVDADNDRPQTLWGFESTNRGIATFQTCLKVRGFPNTIALAIVYNHIGPYGRHASLQRHFLPADSQNLVLRHTLSPSTRSTADNQR